MRSRSMPSRAMRSRRSVGKRNTRTPRRSSARRGTGLRNIRAGMKTFNVTQDVFAEIRRACRLVADRAKHVRVCLDRIDDYASSLPINRAIAPTLDTATHYLGEPRDTLAFFLTLDTINFGSGYFPHLKKRPGMSGYFTIASSLTDHFREHGPIPPHQLANLSAEACARM